MMKDLRLPITQRKKFTQPLGKLFSGKREDTIGEVISFFKKERKINKGVYYRVYCVGDIVTKDFLENVYLREMIKICIIDEKTKRQKIDTPFTEFFEQIIELENPTGTISKDMWSKLKQLIENNRRVLVKIVEGEEDLLVIPLISGFSLLEGIKSYVFYGQPPVTDSEKPIPEGLVCIEVTTQIKKMVSRLIKLMEKY